MTARTARTSRRLGFLPAWRPFTWVIVAFNLLMLVWVVAGAASASRPSSCAGLSSSTCQQAADVGTAIGVGLLIGLWVAGDVILGVLWLVTRPRGRQCPACGVTARRGVMVCRGCGFDFAAAALRERGTV